MTRIRQQPRGAAFVVVGGVAVVAQQDVRRDIGFAGQRVREVGAFDGSPLMIVVFPLALLGLPLMIHGKRVGQMVRAERRGHRHTIDVVHAARMRRRRH